MPKNKQDKIEGLKQHKQMIRDKKLKKKEKKQALIMKH